MGAAMDDVNPLLRDLVVASSAMHPDDVAAQVRVAAERLGGTDVDVMVADLSQQELSSLLAVEQGDSVPILGSPSGDAYRNASTVAVALAGGARFWVPMLDSAERVGVLGVTVADSGADAAPWEALASLAAELLVAKSRYGVSIARARRTQPTTLAAEMRWALLPPLTFGSQHVTVTGILEPAHEIAGDAFDYAIDGDLVHLAIFDAMGHGLEASQMANVAVASYRHSTLNQLPLEETAKAMDDAVQACFDRSRYVTGQLATLDTRSRRFRMLNMGHPLPLLIRSGRVLGELPSYPNMPAGWGDKAATIYETDLQLGDMVLMYTDGLTEARATTGELYGIERLVSSLGSVLAEHRPPEEVLRTLINDVTQFQDSSRDDATLLLAGLPLRQPGIGALPGS